MPAMLFIQYYMLHCKIYKTELIQNALMHFTFVVRYSDQQCRGAQRKKQYISIET